MVNTMQNVIRADDIKPDFEGLKNKWEEMLQKYYIDANMLDPKYTCKFLARIVVQSIRITNFFLMDFVTKHAQNVRHFM